MTKHRHHLRYAWPQIIVRIPDWLHWAIHVPASFPFCVQTQLKWTFGSDNPFDGAIAAQNKAAKAIGLKWLLGYPNVVQMMLNAIAWLVCGWGWLMCAGVAIVLFIALRS